MMCMSYILVVLMTSVVINSSQILAQGLPNNMSCLFENTNIFTKRDYGPEFSIYTCKLTASLKYYNWTGYDMTRIDLYIRSKFRIYDEVKAVEMLGKSSGSYVDFIPPLIFSKIFPFLEYFIMTAGAPEMSVLRNIYFKFAKKLKVLRIEHTSITSLESYLFFNGPKHLEFLTLSNNQISTIHNDAFAGLDDLKSLTIENNPIKFLDYSTFSSLHNLEILNLLGGGCYGQKFDSRVQIFNKIAIAHNCQMFDVSEFEEMASGSSPGFKSVFLPIRFSTPRPEYDEDEY